MLKSMLALGLTLLVVIALFWGVKAVAFGKKNTENPITTEATDTNTVTELQVKDTVVGTGDEAVAGRTVVVHYTGTLYPSGEKFDSSLDRGEPFEFPLGAGRVIQGWDKGVAGMKVGGERTLIIPPDMAYGRNGVPGAIPPNAVLKFDVQLLEVR